MSKKCTPLWREVHFEVKTYKTHHCRTTFGSCDVEKVHAVVARSTFPSQNVHIQTHRHTDTQTHRHTDIQTYRHTDIQTYRHTDIHYITLRYVTLRYITLHYITAQHSTAQNRTEQNITYVRTYVRMYVCMYICGICPLILDILTLSGPGLPPSHVSFSGARRLQTL